MKSIKEWIEECHKFAKDKGFWNYPDEMRDCQGNQYLDNLVISQKLMLIVSELSEGLESLRNNKRTTVDLNRFSYADNKTPDFEIEVKDTFEDELADTVIRIFDLCGWLDIDLEKHIELKMTYNKTRPPKHNKEF